ncbi:MAG: adenylate/guanylate cyclase domain-containing protein [Methyloglobulus sp.]|nr:adenylate/guanylate cyclase domain-containing protein [Methyloglobulus sp.]
MGSYLEEEFGLTELFLLRGALPAPLDVIIVSIDRASAEILHLPDDPEKWPRMQYAHLIDKINQQNPAIIAFNIHFGENREPEDDQVLANAMAARRNVILSNYLKQSLVPAHPPFEEIRYERVIEPTPLLNSAALGSAPFPIPKTSSTVKEFWTYKHSAGDIPTFPISIFQYYVIKKAYPEILQLLSKIDPGLAVNLPDTFTQLIRNFGAIQKFQEIQAAFTKDSAALNQLTTLITEAQYSSGVKQLLQSWLALLKSDERLYLNHYGDVGTITTVPFYQASITAILNPSLFRDKIVLVGYSEDLEPEKNQGFYTAFSKLSGKVISPIEIAATAIANIIDRSWLKPMPISRQLLLIISWGILLSGVFCLFSYQISMLLTVLLMAGYIELSSFLFASKNVWMPLAIPLLQGFVVLLIQSTAYFIKVRKVSKRYIPKEVFDTNTRNPEGMNEYGILMQGVCMATDAGQYTTLSETVSPLQLHKLMNDYYAAIFPGVKSRRGLISDVIGDAMLAVWAAPKIDIKLRYDACHAALEIKSAIDHFNATSQYHLATRMGLHYGEMRLGNVGAMEHYEYRAVGDTVNTATRIEGLNKLLGTRILVSAPVIAGLPGFFTRELGTFLLKGKMLTVTVFELIGHVDEIARTQPHWQHLSISFAQALALFKDHQWQQALAEFLAIEKDYPHDGPTRFYICYLQNLPSLSLHPSKDHAATIDIGKINMLLH